MSLSPLQIVGGSAVWKVGAIMSDNDRILLDANFKNWLEGRGAGLTKSIAPFTYYVLEQFLKPYDPNDDDIAYGITDGPNDGGVDAIYFLINRSTFVQDDTNVDSRSITKIRIIIIQLKGAEEGFKYNEILKLHAFTDDLLSLTKPAAAMAFKYHAHLIQIMDTIKTQYLKAAGGFPTVNVDYYYSTRMPDATPDTKATDAARRVTFKARELLTNATCAFNFVNGKALLAELAKRRSRSRAIMFSETPMQAKDGYVGLVKLPDYKSFISDGDELAEHIFEANVRGFQQDTTVNKEIRASLLKPGAANFWLLNNGITIIAESAAGAGHLKYELMDPQVVNGLQTSREIFNYFKENRPSADERAILVRVLPTTDDVVRDTVVKATNSQNKMDAASLRAFDPIHHGIEDVFKRHGLFYDRRKGYYKDKGCAVNKIVSVMEVLKATVAIVLQRPNDARARSGDYINDDDRYKSVFGQDVLPLLAFVKCVHIMRAVEAFLDDVNIESGDKWNIKFYIAAGVAREITDELDPSPERIAALDADKITVAVLDAIYRRVLKTYRTLGGTDTVAKGPELAKRLHRSDARRRYRAARLRSGRSSLPPLPPALSRRVRTARRRSRRGR